MKLLQLIIFVSMVSYAHAQDWPGLKRYHAQDSIDRMGTIPDDRVVFMGNSITDFWIDASPDFFAENHFIDRGISGQTSPQMLCRFRADVVNLKPQVVVLLCGVNDIAGNSGPSTLEMIEDNIMSMADIARIHNIKIILSSVLPANKFGWKPDVEPANKIIALNAWIKSYAMENNFQYLDYFTPLVNDQKGMKAEYSSDGVHPNKEGYRIMEDVALPVIKKLLRK